MNIKYNIINQGYIPVPNGQKIGQLMPPISIMLPSEIHPIGIVNKDTYLTAHIRPIDGAPADPAYIAGLNIVGFNWDPYRWQITFSWMTNWKNKHQVLSEFYVTLDLTLNCERIRNPERPTPPQRKLKET